MKKMMIICILALLLLSCEKEPIKIGLVATLSGGSAEIGISIRDSLLLKVDEINEAGGINGRKVEIIIRDDRNDHNLIKQYNKELRDLGVDALWGYELSSKYEAIKELINDDIIVISPTLSSDQASNIDDNFFRTIATNVNQGSFLAEYALEQNNKNTLIIYDQNNIAFSQGVIDGYKSVFEAQGGQVGEEPIIDLYSDGKEDEIIERYKGHDSVLLVLNPNDCATVAQMFYKSGIQTDFYSSPWGMISDAYKGAGKAMEGFVFASHIGNASDPRYLAFLEKYKAYYNNEPQFVAVYAYEAAIMYFEALKNTKDFSTKNVKESMLALKDIEGVISVLNFNDFGDIERTNYIAILKDGELVIEE